MTIGNETIQLRLEDRTAWITLDRPPLNILDISTMQALDAVLERALSKCDFVIFQGAGPQAFSAGAEIADHTPERVEKMLSAFHAVFRRLAAADCLTILPLLIGMRAAAHLILTGQQINAAEASRLGLVTRVVPDDKLAVALDSLLEELQTLSPSVLQLTRKTLGGIHFAGFAKQLEEVEHVYLSELMQGHDAREGILAFLEKRAPLWRRL